MTHATRGVLQAPDIGGRVLLRFTIGPDGRAGSITVDEDELGDAIVTDCLRAQLSSWQFPRPRDGVPITVAYPFVFSSADSLRAAGAPGRRHDQAGGRGRGVRRPPQRARRLHPRG